MDDFDDDSIHSSDGAASDDSEEACRILSSSKEKRNRNRKWEDADSGSSGSDGEEDPDDNDDAGVEHPKPAGKRGLRAAKTAPRKKDGPGGPPPSMPPPPFPPGGRPTKARRQAPPAAAPAPASDDETDGQFLSALLAGGDASVDTFLDGLMKPSAEPPVPAPEPEKPAAEEYSSDDILADLMGGSGEEDTHAPPEPRPDEAGGSDAAGEAAGTDELSSLLDGIDAPAPSALDQLLAGHQPEQQEAGEGDDGAGFEFLAKIASATAARPAKRKRPEAEEQPPPAAAGSSGEPGHEPDDDVFAGIWSVDDTSTPAPRASAASPALKTAAAGREAAASSSEGSGGGADDLAALYQRCSAQDCCEWTLRGAAAAGAAADFWVPAAPAAAAFGAGSDLWSALDKAAVKPLPGAGDMAFGTDRWGGAPAGRGGSKRAF
ncbi:hypothetical protein DIPPA_12098 [Diplonema papillatum]|nr:hypothetical protein DIPPA_12098 [Diplonema papillatum]